MKRKQFVSHLAIAMLAVAGTFWPLTGNAEAGDGLRAGDLKLSPRLSLSGAYDENVFRLDPDDTGAEDGLISSPVLGIEPGLSIATIDPTSVDFTLDGSARWDQYLTTEERAQQQSGLQGAGDFNLTLNPRGAVSFGLLENIVYTNEAPPYASERSFNRLVNRAGGEFGIHPGDQILDITLGYKYSLYRHYTSTLVDLDKDSHDFDLDITWKFLPKTALVIDGDASVIQYQEPFRGFQGGEIPNVDSTPIHARGGLSGLISRRISARLLAGYAVGLYQENPTYSGPVGHADFAFNFGPLNLDNELSLGYERSFEDSAIGNFFSYHQVNLDLRQNFADKRFGYSLGGEFTRRDYATIQANEQNGIKVVQNERGQTVFLPDDLHDNYLTAKVGLHTNMLKWWRASLEYMFEANITDDVTNVPAAANAEYLRRFQRHLVTLTTTIHY